METSGNHQPAKAYEPSLGEERRRGGRVAFPLVLLLAVALPVAALAATGCQATREEEPVWYYFPGHDTYYSEPDDVYLVWDGRRWIQIRTRPEALVDETARPFAEVAPTPFAQWAPHPRSYQLPFDYEPYPYLQFRFSAPQPITPEHPRPYYYDEQPYPIEPD